MRYEMIREIFNQCSNNQMRDVSISIVETDDPDELVEPFRKGKVVEENVTTEPNGDIVYDLVVDGLKERITFSKE